MKTASAGLIALLNTGSFVQADCYTFALADGTTVLRYTTADHDVAYGGNTYTASGPLFDRVSSESTGHWKIGFDVDTWRVHVMPIAVHPITGAAFPARINGQPWLAAVRSGALDGAEVDIDRAYWAAWPTYDGANPAAAMAPDQVLADVFAGRVAAVDITRGSAVISINSHLELLNIAMPRNLYQSGCRHTLFDAGCALTAGSFAASGTVSVVTNNGQFTTGLSQAADYFSLGRLVWTSGANTGFARMVRKHDTGGSIKLIAPMPFTVAPSDAFTIYPGCDKQLTTCTSKFTNTANFGGFPYIPAPETAI